MPTPGSPILIEPARVSRLVSVEPLIRRLETFATLSLLEKATVVNGVGRCQCHETDRSRILNTAVDGVTVIVSGLACRYRLSHGGRRQILGYLIAGDLCGLHISSLVRPDQRVSTFGPTTTAALSLSAVMNDPEQYPNLTRALLWSMLVEESTSREWLANVGHRTAFERVAHLFCEMYLRMKLVGLTGDNACALPLAQRDLGDALSLSASHVNRILRQMRVCGLLYFNGKQLVVPDLGALRAAAGFDSTYLYGHGVSHPSQRPTQLSYSGARTSARRHS